MCSPHSQVDAAELTSAPSWIDRLAHFQIEPSAVSLNVCMPEQLSSRWLSSEQCIQLGLAGGGIKRGAFMTNDLQGPSSHLRHPFAHKPSQSQAATSKYFAQKASESLSSNAACMKTRWSNMRKGGRRSRQQRLIASALIWWLSSFVGEFVSYHIAGAGTSGHPR
jgi:hypothetical protein